MALTASQLADLMPDATQLESVEPEMESSLHYAQLALLVACLEWLWRDRQLRYFSSEEQLVPTPEEDALQAEQQTLQAQQRAEQAQQRAEQLAEQLRSLGIEPEA